MIKGVFLRIPTNTISYETRLNAFDKNRIYRMFIENNTISILLNHVKFLAVLYDQIRHFKSFDLNSLKNPFLCLRVHVLISVLCLVGNRNMMLRFFKRDGNPIRNTFGLRL